MGWGTVAGFLLLVSGTQAYNLNENDLGILRGNGQADSLFGWSLQHFGNDLYVGAPGEDGKGAVYRCSNVDTSSENCQKMTTPRVLNKSWYGGSLAASDSHLYTCSFRHGYTNYNPKKQYIGKCFEKNGNAFKELINFLARWSNKGGSTWKTNGVYGVSATVSDKSGKLVVGSPITFDNKGMWNNPYISVGSIGLIESKNSLTKPSNNAPWTTKDSDISTMRNTFKNAGYSLGTGMFFTGNPKSYIVGAPKDNNYRGSVYVCHNCFGERSDKSRLGVRFPEGAKNLEVHGLQMGESFGAATAACDITGDGRDDLIVGAPTYSPNRKIFNSGRIHIFLKFTHGEELRRVSPMAESKIEPPGHLDESMGARFGSAVACLGDTDGDSSEEVVVGAPFYDTHGAIFLYRAKKDRTKGLVLSQIIKSQGTSRFGMKLTPSKLDASIRGFAVGAPSGQSSAYIKVRNVPRFTDISRVEIEPRSVDPRNTETIVIKVTPSIQRRTDFADTLTITAKIVTDNRLVGKNVTLETEITRDATFVRPLKFSFSPRELNFGLNMQDLNVNDMKSLVFKISLEYKLKGCKDSYRNPCPVFDPEDTTGGQKTEEIEKKKITKKLPDQTVDFNICTDAGHCLCDIKTSIEKANNVVAGASTDIHMGDITITNMGTEPSFRTDLEVAIDKNSYMFVLQGNCFFNANLTVCSLPFFNSKNEQNSQRTFPLKLSPIELITPDTDFVEIQVKLTSECKNKNSVIVEEKFKIPVKHEWKIKAEQRSSQESQTYLWDQKIEKEENEESETVALTYKVYNEGPSMSKESKLYVFLPTDSQFLDNIKVTFTNTECKLGDQRKNQIPPPPPPSNSDDETEMLVCRSRGDCKVFECDLPKGMEKQDRAPLKVQFDFVKKNAKLMEKVSKFQIVTSICTMSHKEDKNARCVTSSKKVLRTMTSFEYIRKTTLDLLIASWQLVVGGIAALIVFIIVFVVFYKCELFKKVRFYKNMGDTDELVEEGNAEDQASSEVEIDGEKIELRT